MLTAFGRAFRTPDLRRKFFFTLGIIAVYRLGSRHPGARSSPTDVQPCLDQSQGNQHLLAGQPVQRWRAAPAVGLRARHHAVHHGEHHHAAARVVIPRFEALKKEGQSGQPKLTQYTRYLTVALAMLQATGIVALARSRATVPGLQPTIFCSTTTHFRRVAA